MLAVARAPGLPSPARQQNSLCRASSLSCAGSRIMAEPKTKAKAAITQATSDTQFKRSWVSNQQESSLRSKSKPGTPQSIELKVGSLSGTEVTVQACRTDAWSKVQKQVADKLNVPQYRITLSDENGLLKGKKTLEECTTSEDSKLFFVIGAADKWRDMSSDAFVDLLLSRGLATRQACAQTAKFDAYKMRQEYIPRLESIERAEEHKRLREERRETLQQSVVSEASAMVSKLGVAGAANEIQVKFREVERRCSLRMADAQALRADAQRDLDQALPALNAAVHALNSLTKASISEIKVCKSPSASLALVGEAMCILFELPPTWSSFQKMVGDIRILDKMISYDKDNISPTVIKSLDAYMQRPEFSPDEVGRASMAGRGMCMWVRAMHTYDRIAQVVFPKKQRLMEAQDDLEDARLELELWQKEMATLSAEPV